MFTNSKTLFSFFVYAGTKKELNNIEEIFEEKLQEQIVREISTFNKYIPILFPKDTNYRFTKTNSRSVIGSMNDIKYQIKIQISHNGELKHSYDLINHLINEVPMGALKYSSSNEKIKEELESLIKK